MSCEKVVLSASHLVPVSSLPIKDGAVLVENDRIKDIGVSDIIGAKYPGVPARHFPDSILMPGLVNCHIHLEYSALGPLRKRVDFIKWIKDLIVRQKVLSEQQIIFSIKKAVGSLISSGITAVGEVSHSGLSLGELERSGLKGVYYNEFVATDDIKLDKHNGRNFKIGVFPHSVYTLSTEVLQYVSSFCRKNKFPCGIHVAESYHESEFVSKGTGQLAEFVRSFQLETAPKSGRWRGTLEYLADLKFLNPLTHLVHCIHLKEKDFALLEKTKTGVVICPRSNYLLKNGEFPLRTALKYKLKLGLGTDSLASNHSLDMFKEMRMLKNSSHIEDDRLIEIATLGGAEILGLEKEIGSLAVGKMADIIAVKIDCPAEQVSPLSYIVSHATSKNVCWTMIDGVAKYEQA